MQALVPETHETEDTQSTDLCLGDHDAFSGTLQEALYNEIVRYKCKPNDKEFIPTERVVNLLDTKTLEIALGKYDSFLKSGPQRLQSLRFGFPEDETSPEAKARRRSAIVAKAKQIYGNMEAPVPLRTSTEHKKPSPSDEDGPYDKSYVKILAILILIDRPARIKLFIDEGICDADLPLVKEPAEGTFKELRRTATRDKQLKCFERWDHRSMVRFEQYQWKLLAPSFERGGGKNIRHQSFDSSVILPFTKRSQHSKSGGFGEVTKVRIHQDHHNFKNDGVGPHPSPKSLICRVSFLSNTSVFVDLQATFCCKTTAVSARCQVHLCERGRDITKT